MKQRPILFSGPMVKAILDGNKITTRRLVKPMAGLQSTWLDEDMINAVTKITLTYIRDTQIFGLQMWHPDDQPIGFIKCPFGKVGDLLWVREAWCYLSDEDGYTHWDQFRYRIDNPDVRLVDGDGFGVYRKDGSQASPWRPSIHMPKAACRIWLKITNISVERLQVISGVDAIEEGIESYVDEKGRPHYRDYLDDGWYNFSVHSFKSLWAKINGQDSWEENPWVWVIKFERIEKPTS